LQYEYDIASDEYKKACEAEDKVNGRWL
jgi:hypothetical protein